MSWTQHMYEVTRPLWERIYEHPFLKGLADGSLSEDRLRFYFEQNIRYIEAVIRCRSLATAKAQNAEIRDFFLQRTDMVVDEFHHQEQMLSALGGRLDAPIAPTCYAYTTHLLNIAWSRDPVEYLGTFLPCPWSYDEIGRRLSTVALRGVAAEWWEFYMSTEHNELCDRYRGFVDKYADDLSDERRQQMLVTFRIGLNYEYLFWDMAYNQEQWPLE